MTIKPRAEFLKLIILFFMLFAVDFLGMGWYIFGGAFALTVMYLIITRKDLVVNSLFGWVIILAISNFLIMYVNSNADIITKVIKYLIAPIGAFAIATVFASEENKNESILKLYMYAVIPYFIHGVLDIAIFDGFVGFERELPDFWTGELWKATLVCTYFAMTVPLCFVALITKGFWKKIIYFSLTVVSVYASIITASRTVIYIGLIVIVLEFILYISKVGSLAKKTKFILIFALIIFVVFVFAITNMESLSSTDFFNRMTDMEMSDEPRIHLFKNILYNFWAYPFGNMPYFYSHNTWLDFLRESGWITFMCFFVITVITINHMIKIYKNDELKLEHRIAVIGMMTALLIDMFVEPVMDGAAILFCLFFYFIGINNYYVKNSMRMSTDVKIEK